MKKVSLLILFAFAYCVSFAQYPTVQNLGAPKTLVTSKGGLSADSALILPVFPDTISANLSPYVKYYAGNMIRVGNNVYIRNATATAWIGVGGGGSGSVTSISQGYGIVNTPNPIVATGTIKVDTATLSGKYVRVSDTTSMLNPYVRKTTTISTTSPLTGGGNLSNNLTLSIPAATSSQSGYLSSSDFNSFTNKVDTIYRTPGKDSIQFKINGRYRSIKDSVGSGTMTTLYTSYGIQSSVYPITTSGTIRVDTTATSNGLSSKYLRIIDTTNKWVTKAVDTISRTPGKDSIIFTINGKRYAIKDSVGSGGGGAFPGGSVDNIQFKGMAGNFQGSNDLVFTASEDAGYTNRLGVGTNSPIGKAQIKYSTQNYTNTGGEDSHLFLQNQNAVGQTSIYSEINGNPVMKWRTDFIGGNSIVSYGNEGYHAFYTNGDYPNGTAKLIIHNNGDVGIGEQLPDNGYKLQVNGESYFYNPNSANVCLIEGTNGFPIQILTVDETINNTYTATQGSIGNSPNGLYENINGDTKWRKMTRPYRSYVAQLSQSGTNAPTEDVLENDLGYDPTWTRTSAGYYNLSSTQLSNENENKVVVFINAGNNPGSLVENGIKVNATWNKDDKVIYVTSSYFTDDVGGFGYPGFVADDGILSDEDGFNKTNIEIRIYD